MSARSAFFLLGMLYFSLPAHAAPAELRAGGSLLLARPDATRLLGMDEDLGIVVVEIEGAEVALRLTPLDRDGADIGVGRVILVGPSERREIPLRRVLHESQLEGLQLRVEALRGDGRVEVIASTSDGAELKFAPEQTGHVRGRPVRLRTTDGLIDDAEASGAINAETAMLYRVYALFSDTRLPAQYRGIDRPTEDSLYLDEVRDRFATLSPATQELLQPFLTPPSYADSWANARGSGPTALDTPPPCQIFSDDWGFVDSPSGVAWVWYRRDSPDALKASAVAAAVSGTIWPALSGLMAPHLPLSDQAERCNGGNPNLDIYLVDVSGPSLTAPYGGCGPGPAFILLKRTAQDPLVAHEVFHAFQRSFPVLGCLSSANYHWWAEGSAKWAEDFVYKNANLEHNFVDSFVGVPEQPLDLNDANHRYGSYLLPFFVHRKTGSANFVKVAWEKCGTEAALEAVDQALPGGFKEVWPEFAVANWNEDPAKDYRAWDTLEKGVSKQVAPEEVDLNGSPDANELITVNLPRLSATYRHFKFTDDNVRTVAFWNGATRILSQPDDFETEDASEAQKKGGRVQALIKIRGQQWVKEDWTDQGAVTFCRDAREERIDELVLIISNSEFSNRNRKLQSAGIAPLLWVSNMACWRWKGTTSFTEATDTGVIKVDANATFNRMGGRGDTPFVYYDVTGTLTWSKTGICSGSGALAIIPGAAGGGAFLQTFNYTPPGGTHHRAYIAIGSGDGRIVATIPCATNPPSTETVFFPAWLAHDRFEPPFYKVNPIGWIFGDSFVTAGQGSFVWNFTAERE